LIVFGPRDLIERLLAHVEARLSAYAAAGLLVVLGVALGVMAVSVLSPLQKADLLQYLGGFLAAVKAGGVAGPRLMRAAAGANLRGLAVAFVVGASVVGMPVVCFLLVLRGFVVGFTVAFLAGELGARGLWLTLLGVLPPNLLIVPGFMVLTVGAVELALQVARQRRHPRAVWQAYGGYVAMGLVAMLLLVVGSVLEAYVSPGLLGALWPYMAG
jgi:stage II sporulation protein M